VIESGFLTPRGSGDAFEHEKLLCQAGLGQPPVRRADRREADAWYLRLCASKSVWAKSSTTTGTGSAFFSYQYTRNSMTRSWS